MMVAAAAAVAAVAAASLAPACVGSAHVCKAGLAAESEEMRGDGRGHLSLLQKPIDSSRPLSLAGVPLPEGAEGSGLQPDCTSTCATPWLIVLASGRSGSTSVTQMLNALPGVFVGGEHWGALLDLMRFDMTSRFMDVNHRTASHFSRPSARKDVVCKMQDLVRDALLGDLELSKYKVLGFKEIRYNDPATLDFLTKVFPCARFIVNVRRDVDKQVTSGFYDKQIWAASAVAKDTWVLRDWQSKDPATRFLLQLEDFSTNRFDEMLEWLGVQNCSYTQVAHANDNDSYSNADLNDVGDAKLVGDCIVPGTFS